MLEDNDLFFMIDELDDDLDFVDEEDDHSSYSPYCDADDWYVDDPFDIAHFTQNHMGDFYE